MICPWWTIDTAVDKYWGVEPEPLPEPEPVVVAQVPPPSEGQELPTGDKEISETGTGVPPSTETTTATTGEAGTSDEASATLEGGLVATVTRKASIPQVEETPLQKYNRVAFVVDALAASNEPEMLRATIVEMDDHVCFSPTPYITPINKLTTLSTHPCNNPINKPYQHPL